MKIVVVGPGAMGCLFAAFLSKSKEEVRLLDKNKEKSAKLNENGISLEGVSGTWQAKVKSTSRVQDTGKADLILICVKSFHTKQAVEQIKPILGHDTNILTLQNVIVNIEIISEIAGQERVIGGLTN